MIWIALLSALGFAASYGGALHPALDSLTVLRMGFAVALLMALAVSSAAWRRWLWPAAGWAFGFIAWHGGLWTLMPERGALPPGEGITIYQHNLQYGNTDRAGVLAQIRALDPDVVTLQEVSIDNREILEALAESHPNQMHCSHDEYGVAVLSRLPAGEAEGRCLARESGSGSAAIPVIGPDGPGWIISSHIKWPWPYTQAAHVDAITAGLRDLEGPKIVAGDFNAMPWSNAAARMRRASETTYIGPRRMTFTVFEVVPLPLDHVLAGAGDVRRLGYLGSDHKALFARVAFPAP